MSLPTSGGFSETQLSDESFDQPSGPVRAKIFICATGRTGSWLLCRAMIHHGLGIPHEYFNAKHIGLIGRRAGIDALADGKLLGRNAPARQAYVDALLNRRTVDGIFAAKLHWGQYASYLDNPEGDALLRGGHFIHLYRQDLLSQAISFHISRQTGRWGLDAATDTAPAAKPDFFDATQIENEMNVLAEADADWRLFFGRNGITPLALSYEQLTQDVPGAVRAVVEQFGLGVPLDRPDYVEHGPGEARDHRVPPRAEIRERFLRARQRVPPASEPGSQIMDEIVEKPRPPVVRIEAPAVASGRRQRICLCMIVKNEAPVILACLQSVRPLIDYWIIADTGSTDGTQDLITEYLHDIPGELHQRPWVDFAHNRSEVIALARGHADYSLIIDADDTLEIPPGFKMPFLNADSYTMEVCHNAIRHWRPHLVRNALGWRYEGVIHEFLSCDPERKGERSLPENRSQKRLNGVRMIIGEGGARRQQSEAERFHRDAATLEQALSTETDPLLVSRYMFYLAQSLQDSGERGKALACYLKRAELGFWRQEIFISLYRAAQIKADLGHDAADVIACYRDATQIDPRRAEALHGAARYCRLQNRFEEGYEFAKAALRLVPSDDTLFLEQWIYDYGALDEYAVNAYWSDKFAECLKACRQILAGATPLDQNLRARVEANANFAAQKLREKI